MKWAQKLFVLFVIFSLGLGTGLRRSYAFILEPEDADYQYTLKRNPYRWGTTIGAVLGNSLIH